MCGKKLRMVSLFLVLSLLSFSSPLLSSLWAEVVLTDEEAQELMNEITESKKDLQELQTQLEDVKSDYNEQKTSYEKQLTEVEKKNKGLTTAVTITGTSTGILAIILLIVCL